MKEINELILKNLNKIYRHCQKYKNEEVDDCILQTFNGLSRYIGWWGLKVDISTGTSWLCHWEYGSFRKMKINFSKEDFTTFDENENGDFLEVGKALIKNWDRYKHYLERKYEECLFKHQMQVHNEQYWTKVNKLKEEKLKAEYELMKLQMINFRA